MKINKSDEIKEKITNISIKIAKIEQHLENIYGNMRKNENRLERIEKDVIKNKLKITETIGLGGLGGSIAGSILFIMFRLIGIW